MNIITHFSSAGATLILLAALLTGCGRDVMRANSDPQPARSQTPGNSGATTAIAIINPTQGNQARGTVRFVQEGKGVRVMADLTGLTPG